MVYDTADSINHLRGSFRPRTTHTSNLVCLHVCGLYGTYCVFEVFRECIGLVTLDVPPTLICYRFMGESTCFFRPVSRPKIVRVTIQLIEQVT